MTTTMNRIMLALCFFVSTSLLAGGPGKKHNYDELPTHSIIFKAGTMDLNDDLKDILGAGFNLDKNGTSYGLEWESINSANGVGFGLEYLTTKHDFTDLGTPGEMDTRSVMVNVRKYMPTSGYFKPFIGAGIGFMEGELSGSINQDADGLALQVMGGFRFQFVNKASLYGEIKYLDADLDDNFGNKIKASGLGAYLGFSIPISF